MAEIREIHETNISILLLMKEKYITALKDNIKNYTNIIYFVTYAPYEKINIWQFYFNSAKRHCGELNNMTSLQVPSKALIK